MLEVVGSEAAEEEVDGRSLLDDIAREGARRMPVSALETGAVVEGSRWLPLSRRGTQETAHCRQPVATSVHNTRIHLGPRARACDRMPRE